MKKDMRVAVTERMLREGMLRCLEDKPLSRITVSDLCRESGINRSTFYTHYETPTGILREMARRYAGQLTAVYTGEMETHRGSDEAALEACLDYIARHRSEIKILFSKNAEHCLSGFGMEIVAEKAAQSPLMFSPSENREDAMLCSVTVAAGICGLMEVWLTMDIDKTPAELVGILKRTIRAGTAL